MRNWDMHVLTVTAIIANSRWFNDPRTRVINEPYPEIVYARWARDHANQHS